MKFILLAIAACIIAPLLGPLFALMICLMMALLLLAKLTLPWIIAAALLYWLITVLGM